jgi:thiol-disulfide isomerase/thioredoxin
VFRWLAGGLGVVGLIVIIAAFYPNGIAQNSGPTQSVGMRVPAVRIPLVTGGMLDLRSLRGRPALVNVWATWCGPCRREMPALERLAREQQRRLTVVAVDQGEDIGTARAFARRFGVTFAVGVDASQQLGTELHLAGLPSSFFIDKDGIIREAVDGEMTYETMLAKVKGM